MRTLSDLWFWFDRWRFAEGRYWRFADPCQADILDALSATAVLEITRGRYQGTKWCFKHVTLNGHSAAHFDFHIINGDLARIERRRFSWLVRKILLNILWALYSGDDSRLQVGLKPGQEFANEDGEIGVEEPGPVRAIRSKGPGVSVNRTVREQRRPGGV